MIGLGTVLNVVVILVGATLGVLLGQRLPQRTRDAVTDGLGLVVLLIAALSAASVLDPAVTLEVGSVAVLIVLGSVLIGGVSGSLLRIEDRLESLGERVRVRLAGRLSAVASSPGSTTSPDAVDVEVDGALAADGDADLSASPAQPSFAEGFVTASLVFCVGPLTILGALSDGLGLGIDQLALKSALDGFAAIAFAASLGWGVAASALVVAVYQGSLTVLGSVLGSVLSLAQVALLTATGGLLLVGIALRLLRLRQVPVGDLLPALIVAPVLTALVSSWR